MRGLHGSVSTPHIVFMVLVFECVKCTLKHDKHTSFVSCMRSEAKALVTQSCPTLETPWTVAHQAPLSVGFSRQEYWSGLPFPSPGDLPDPGIEPASAALQADSLPLSHHGSLPLLLTAHRQNRTACALYHGLAYFTQNPSGDVSLVAKGHPSSRL